MATLRKRITQYYMGRNVLAELREAKHSAETSDYMALQEITALFRKSYPVKLPRHFLLWNSSVRRSHEPFLESGGELLFRVKGVRAGLV